ncbi:hypothetical protein TSUD_201870 [Trifolium subterraneum]|uniref:Uncharacterized protein n=1 Tax=Trifolium subterraneum TaxID=3900 RepID=A0A2Z6LKI2_TRISU|nr:hypothetical protein TSUD_201870 [Trifolium subterraneum]
MDLLRRSIFGHATKDPLLVAQPPAYAILTTTCMTQICINKIPLWLIYSSEESCHYSILVGN